MAYSGVRVQPPITTATNAMAAIDTYLDGEVDQLYENDNEILAIIATLGGVVVSGNTASRPVSGDVIYHNTQRKAIELIESGAWVRDAALLNASAVTMYVNGSSGADTNDGLSSGAAKQTLQGVIDSLPSIYGANITINVADGTYAGFNLVRHTTYGANAPIITLTGNAGAPANVIINTTMNVRGVFLTMNGFTIKPGAANGIFLRGSLTVLTLTNCVINSTINPSYGASVSIGAGCTFSGDNAAYSLLYASRLGYIAVSTPTPTLTFAAGQAGNAIVAEDGGLVSLPTGTSITNCKQGIVVLGSGGRVFGGGSVSITTATGLSGSSNGIYIDNSGCINIYGALTINGSSYASSNGVQCANGGFLRVDGAINISNVLFGIFGQSATLKTGSTVAITCINNAGACGIWGNDVDINIAGALTLTGGGAGTGISLARVSKTSYASVTYAGTWGANSNIAANSVVSTT